MNSGFLSRSLALLEVLAATAGSADKLRSLRKPDCAPAITTLARRLTRLLRLRREQLANCWAGSAPYRGCPVLPAGTTADFALMQ
jgi:hypothetical protein